MLGTQWGDTALRAQSSGNTHPSPERDKPERGALGREHRGGTRSSLGVGEQGRKTGLKNGPQGRLRTREAGGAAPGPVPRARASSPISGQCLWPLGCAWV